VIEKFIHSIFGEPSEKAVKEIAKNIPKIHIAEEKFADYSAEDIKKKTAEFQALFSELDIKNEADSVKIREILESIKIEAFALVKTACKQLNGNTFQLSGGKSITWNMVPYDVQLIGGLAIHEGNISEMKTGE
jgi:preprotein translocase subunit SecA